MNLQRMREYRSLLANEVNALVNNHVTNGTPPAGIHALATRVCLLEDRMRMMNFEIDKQMAIQLGRKDAQKEVEFARP